MEEKLGALPEKTLLYRGVHAFHPVLLAAMMGVAIPGDSVGTISALEHNRGRMGTQERSPFTSFTRQFAIARIHAWRSGPGGIILVAESGAPARNDSWRWEWSPDEFFEEEVLLKGIRTELGVLKL